MVALRLFAALLVIYGHSWAVAHDADGPDWLTKALGVFSGTIAVDIFFVVSGLLVTMSYARRDSIWTFVGARALRIFPALICCVAVTTFLLGSVMTTLPSLAYLRQRATWSYLVENIGLLGNLQWTLPGVFEHNFNAGVVNGSIWTLPAELEMYGYVLVFGVLGLLRNRTAFTVALAGLSALVLAHAPYIRLVAAADYVPWAGFFAFGALCYVFRDRAFVSWTILAGLASLCALSRGTAGYPLALGATIAYAALWLGFTPLFRHWRLENDYSYGIYLYGFPVQQTWAALYPDWGPWNIFFVSASSAVLLGAMSWHFIEHPALRLKVALPGAKRRARGDVAENPPAGIRIDHGESARVGNR